MSMVGVQREKIFGCANFKHLFYMAHGLGDESAGSGESVASEKCFELRLAIQATAGLKRMTQSASELFLVPERDSDFLGSKIPAFARLGLTIGKTNQGHQN
jgi:hypothetical protein